MPTEVDYGRPVHPALAHIPLMTIGELEGLAASIKRVGLLEAIMLKGEVLIAGRCRIIACSMAGVEPRFEQLPEGKDARDWIVSSNLRRHHHPGEARRAMALVLAARFCDDDSYLVGIHPELVEMVSAVADEAPWSVRGVLAGMPLYDVYQEVLRTRALIARHKREWTELHSKAPAIADMVLTETITHEDAMTILRRQRFAGCSFEWAADPAASSAQFVSCEGGLDDPDNDLSPAG